MWDGFSFPSSLCSFSCLALASFLPLGLNYTIKKWQGGGTEISFPLSLFMPLHWLIEKVLRTIHLRWLSMQEGSHYCERHCGNSPLLDIRVHKNQKKKKFPLILSPPSILSPHLLRLHPSDIARHTQQAHRVWDMKQWQRCISVYCCQLFDFTHSLEAIKETWLTISPLPKAQTGKKKSARQGKGKKGEKEEVLRTKQREREKEKKK